MRRLPVVAALLALLVMAPRAHARAVFADELPERVVAGEEIPLRWSGLPPGVIEVEVLLSLDGGRSFPLRVSRETDARDGRIAWRVPAFACGAAVLELRMGTRSGEIAGVRSRGFRILDPVAGGVRSLVSAGSPVREGDLWLGFEAPPGPGAAALQPPGARIEASEAALSLAPTEPVALAPPALRPARNAAPGARAATASPAGRAPGPARILPLRI